MEDGKKDSKKPAGNQQEIDYLELAHDCVLEFEHKIRMQGLRTFNVWKHLESELDRIWKSEYRQPPRAATIASWFEKDPITKSKMGADDLMMICEIINDARPLVAFYREGMRRLPEEAIEKADDVIKVTDDLINSLYRESIKLNTESSQVGQSLEIALANDKIIDAGEWRAIKKEIEETRAQLDRIERMANKYRGWTDGE